MHVRQIHVENCAFSIVFQKCTPFHPLDVCVSYCFLLLLLFFSCTNYLHNFVEITFVRCAQTQFAFKKKQTKKRRNISLHKLAVLSRLSTFFFSKTIHGMNKQFVLNWTAICCQKIDFRSKMFLFFIIVWHNTHDLLLTFEMTMCKSVPMDSNKRPTISLEMSNKQNKNIDWHQQRTICVRLFFPHSKQINSVHWVLSCRNRHQIIITKHKLNIKIKTKSATVW